ncbi:MAG: hypothetical protein JJLCMIEE_03334 [Acidimicrobiales bacterium]|nr:hypothetical protein [Acidimicrobiales bacterium]
MWPLVIVALVMGVLVSAVVVLRSRSRRLRERDDFEIGGEQGRRRELMDLYRAAQQAEEAGHPEAARQVRAAIARLEAEEHDQS